MHCPACHAENAAEAVTCSACGGPLARDATPSARRSGSRRRASADDANAAESGNHRATRRAFRLALWSLVPGLGLFLGPAAVVLGCLSVRQVAEDVVARSRAQIAILFGTLATLTQWLGLALMIHGWKDLV